MIYTYKRNLKNYPGGQRDFIRVIHQEICGQIRCERDCHKVFLKNHKNAEVLKLGLLYPCVWVIAPFTEAEPEPIYEEL